MIAKAAKNTQDEAKQAPMSLQKHHRPSLPPTFRRLVVGGIVLPLALAFVLGGIFCWQVVWLLKADEQVRQSDQFIDTISAVQALLIDMETGMRAYLMTGKDLFLQPYRAADPQLDVKLRELSNLAPTEKYQDKAVAYLAQLAKAWRLYSREVCLSVQQGDPKFQSVDMIARGKASMDFIRTVIAKITQIEIGIRDTRSQEVHRTVVTVLITSIALSIVVGLILAFASRRLLFAAADTYTDALQRAEQRENEKAQLLASERSARSVAEHANRMKDEFLATLSHELRTPLNAILGWAHILQRQYPGDGSLTSGLETIERNARVQTQLIEDLLDMSRIISGKLRLDIQRITPISFIEPAIDTVSVAAEAKGIRIEKILDPLAGPISGDPARLQQVMWNLLSNAAKFTPKNGKIQVVLERVNSHIEISVADTGEGISAEFLPFVFDRFRQADASSTRKFSGLGLGLSIVKQLVELHGGSIRVKSPGLGQGSTFILQLPLTIVHSTGDEALRVHPASSAAPASQFKSRLLVGTKLLVVDDEADARQLIKHLLEESGAEVLLASSAEEGLSLLERENPDAILSDIGMPDLDGYQFIQKVRAIAQAKGKTIPAIALTAFARSEDRTRSLLAGYQVHLSKPVEPAELLATVASVTGRTIPGHAL
jgi:signal transduction histidine kinase/ActR/RegA family two-component response regulator